MLQLKPQLFEGLDTVSGLRGALQQAVMLEHATIPTYLYALYSLEPGKNAEIQQLITSVVIEEMSHMALACNILNAIGGPRSSMIPPLSRGTQGRSRAGWRASLSSRSSASRSTS